MSDLTAWLIVIAVSALLIAINAFFAMAEFGTISARRSRLAQMAQEGDPLAAQLLPIVEDPRRLDRYVAASQVGITASGLILGFYGQAEATRLVNDRLPEAVSPELAATISVVGVLFVLTSMQIVMGELVPKSVSMRHPERVALLAAMPMRFAMTLFGPAITVLNGSAQLVLRLVGYELARDGAHVHRPEEIMLLVRESGAGGALDAEEQRFLENALRMRDMTVRQAMVARMQLLAAPVTASRDEMLRLLSDSPHTRLLLYGDSLDDVVGAVHLTDLLCASDDTWNAVDKLRPLPFVPGNAPLGEAFARMQREQQPLAVVLDEFGGTAGLIATDDLVEAIFGDVRDEFDADPPLLRVTSGNRVIMRGDARVEDVNESLNLFLPSADATTVGGLVLDALGRVPTPGEEATIGDVTLRVESMKGNAVAEVSLAASVRQLAALKETDR